MEFAAAALASIGGTATAAAGGLTSAASFGAAELIGGGTAAGFNAATAGAAATGVAATAASGSLISALGQTSTWASILSGGATVASVLAMQQSGETKGFGLDMQADDAELSAKVEAVQGLDRRNSLKAALVQAVGERDVAAAASGVDLSFGTPSTARNQAIKDGERALDVDQASEDFRKQRLLERAGNLRLQAGQARSGALGAAAALALEGGAKLAKRG